MERRPVARDRAKHAGGEKRSAEPGEESAALEKVVGVVGGDGQAEGDDGGAADGRYELEQDAPAGGGEFALMPGVGEDAGGDATAGKGQEADQHQRQGQAEAEDADGIEGAGDDVGADAQEENDRGGGAGDDAAGDAEKEKHAKGQGLGGDFGFRIADCGLIGQRGFAVSVIMRVRVGMIVIVAGAMVVGVIMVVIAMWVGVAMVMMLF